MPRIIGLGGILGTSCHPPLIQPDDDATDRPLLQFALACYNKAMEIKSLLRESRKLKARMAKSLQDALAKIEKEKKERVADLEKAANIIRRELADLNGKTSAPAGNRTRRSLEQMRDDAAKALTIIKKAGKEGISGGDIREHVPGVGQNIKEFIEKHTKQKVNTTGVRAGMKYHA